MKISQAGEPRVCLSFDVACAEASEATEFVSVSVPLKMEERLEEEGPMVAQMSCPRGAPLTGKAIEKRSSDCWLVFRIPRERCPEGGLLTFSALVDEEVLWQGAYEVVWRGRFPGLRPTA